MKVAKIGNTVGVEYLYWETATDIEEAKEFFKGEKDWKVCEYFKEGDPTDYCWVNLMHDGDIVPYKTYIVKTLYGIITMNKLAFETLFVKIEDDSKGPKEEPAAPAAAASEPETFANNVGEVTTTDEDREHFSNSVFLEQSEIE